MGINWLYKLMNSYIYTMHCFKLSKMFVNVLANEEWTFLHVPGVTKNNVGKVTSQTQVCWMKGRARGKSSCPVSLFPAGWRRLPLAGFSHSFLLLELLALNGVISVTFSSFSFSFWQ